MEPYKERMVKEYQELRDRTDKLGIMLDKHRKGQLDFEPSCPIHLLQTQYEIMKAYEQVLLTRVEIEEIDL